MQEVEVAIYKPRITRYTERELAQLSSAEAQVIAKGGLMKITGEDRLRTLRALAGEIDALKADLIQTCIANSPLPIFVKLSDNLGRKFISDMRFENGSPNSIFEYVCYDFNQTGREIQKFLGDALTKWDYQLKPKIQERERMMSHQSKERKGEGADPYLVKLWDSQKAKMKEIYFEIADRFGIDKKRIYDGRYELYAHVDAYRTSTEAKQEEIVRGNNSVNLYTVLLDYVEEKGRFIGAGPYAPSYVKQYLKYHFDLNNVEHQDNLRPNTLMKNPTQKAPI